MKLDVRSLKYISIEVFFTLVEKLKSIMLVLDVPKTGEEGKSAPTSSCSLERGEAPRYVLDGDCLGAWA